MTSMEGHNRPPLATKDQLATDYAAMPEKLTALDVRSRRLPATIEDDNELELFIDLVKDLSAFDKEAEATRTAEKEPFLKAGRTVDGFFKDMMLRAGKLKTKTEEVAGIYMRAKAAAEKRRREEEERRAREELARKLAEAQRLENEKLAAEKAAREAAEKAAREATERAERAEKAAREAAAAQARATQAADDKVAAAARQAAAEAARKVEDEAARAKAEGAKRAAEAEAIRLETESNAALEAAAEAERDADLAAKAADENAAAMARTRASSGTLGTLKTVWDFDIDDYDAIDVSVLKPFIKREHIEQAIRAYIKLGHRGLKGVRIYSQEAPMVR